MIKLIQRENPILTDAEECVKGWLAESLKGTSHRVILRLMKANFMNSLTYPEKMKITSGTTLSDIMDITDSRDAHIRFAAVKIWERDYMKFEVSNV